MVRKSLIVAALLAVSSPLAAQDEWVWSSDRPDGQTPLGVLGGRTLGMGEIEIRYQWVQQNYLGVWFGKDSLNLATTLQLYEVAPLSLSDKRHTVQISFGVTNDLTVRARGALVLLEREQLRDDGTYYITTADGLGDLYVDADYRVLHNGPYRFDAHIGAVIPLPFGTTVTRAVTPYSMPAKEALSYDMRPGSGSFAVGGGVSMDVQNEVGSVGAQFRLRTYINENSQGYTLGDQYGADGWAAYKVNDMFSVSAGIRWEKWSNIDGEDVELAPISMRDPMNDPIFLGGLRAGMPLGLNFVFPSGMLAGHRLSFETVYTLHHDYDGPQIGADWGINVGYTAPF